MDKIIIAVVVYIAPTLLVMHTLANLEGWMGLKLFLIVWLIVYLYSGEDMGVKK